MNGKAFADTPHLEEPLAEVERRLIGEYVAAAGHDLDVLMTRNDAEARRILAEASAYASAKLTEVESRSRFVHNLRGDP